MNRWLLLLGAICLSGLLLQQALPRGEKPYLAWIAFVPLIRVTQNRGFVVGFLAGILSVFSGALFAQVGLLYSNQQAGSNDGWLWTGFGLFGFASAFLTAIASEKNAEKRPAWWFAAWAILFESVLLLQLPAHLGLTQYRHPLMMIVASVGGIWLVSYLVWWSNLALARLEPKPLLVFCGASCLLAFVTSFIPWKDPEGTFRVAAIQADVSVNEDIATLHRQVSSKGADLVVWPEFAGILFEKGGDPAEMVQMSRTTSPFVTSFGDGQRPLPHNTAALFAGGREVARYQKRKLFGAENKMFAPGTKPATAALGSLNVGLNVCYDSCFPNIMRQTSDDAKILSLPTNDPPSSHYFIAGMHAAYSTFRAAETGIPLIRADSLAFSQIVDSRGHIRAEAPPGVSVIEANINPQSRFTISKLLGDWWLYLSGLLAVVGWIRYRTK
ncbi:MAG: nitrilase-related carbon-nitrogen hydrolase [Fimbriimonadaceae bacterium]